MNPTAWQIKEMRRQSLAYPMTLQAIPREDWPQFDAKRFGLWRSRQFLVQAYAESNGMVRLSINRTEWDERQKRWREDITWDDIQRLKGEAGYADDVAVEVYPPDDLVVNVANMRHVWIIPGGVDLPFVWKRGQ